MLNTRGVTGGVDEGFVVAEVVAGERGVKSPSCRGGGGGGGSQMYLTDIVLSIDDRWQGHER